MWSLEENQIRSVPHNVAKFRKRLFSLLMKWRLDLSIFSLFIVPDIYSRG
jgi:hypothetical protein